MKLFVAVLAAVAAALAGFGVLTYWMGRREKECETDPLYC